MLGFLYPARSGPGGQPFEGLPATESNNDSTGKPVTVFGIDASAPNAYLMPGANPGEGYANVNVAVCDHWYSWKDARDQGNAPPGTEPGPDPNDT